MEYPFLYEPGIKLRYFNAKRFWLWLLDAVYQSVILGIFSVYILELNFVKEEGYVVGLWTTGAMILSLCVAIVNFKILTFSYAHTPLTVIIIFLSIVIYIISFLIVNFINGSDFEGLFSEMYSLPNFWFGAVVIVVATNFFDLAKERYSHLIEEKQIKRMKKLYNAKRIEEEIKEQEEKKTQAAAPILAAKSEVKEVRTIGTEESARGRNESVPMMNQVYAPLPRGRSKTYVHTGYAFSQEERQSWFRVNRKGLEHPQY